MMSKNKSWSHASCYLLLRSELCTVAGCLVSLVVLNILLLSHLDFKPAKLELAHRVPAWGVISLAGRQLQVV